MQGKPVDKTPSDFGPLFWIHLAIETVVYSSPLLLDWKLVAAGATLYWLQLAVFGNCVLTKAEFGDAPGASRDFHYHYLSKLGLPLKERSVTLYTEYILPALLPVAAIALQYFAGFRPMVRLW